MKKSITIRRIVRIRQMLRAWRLKANASHRSPPDVPPGHVAVCVGSSCRRFIVRATHLNHPIFRRLLSQVEEEYGFSKNPGPLMIPCDESQFEQILRCVSEGDSDFQRCSRNGESDPLGESPLLLRGLTS
ncbi:hypothetical protein ACS0TY_001639 [Phlomoides rotata]